MSNWDVPEEFFADKSLYPRAEGDNWFRVETASDCYYTPFGETAVKYQILGDGTSLPTPKEVVDWMNADPANSVEHRGLYGTTTGVDSKFKPTSLPDGVYMYRRGTHASPERLIPSSMRSDQYVPLSGTLHEIKQHIRDFLANKEVYKKRGIYKIGLMLYGPPGNGKTVTIREIVKEIAPKGSVIIFLEHIPSEEFVIKLNLSMKNRIKFLIFEEFVTIVKDSYMHKVLNFLDGEKSPDEAIIIATTNHPEALPGNIVDRPSRFDALYCVDNPDEAGRAVLIKHYSERDASKEELDGTKDMSIAAIKEAIIYSQLKSISLMDSIKRIRNQSKLAQKAFAKTNRLGVGDD